MSGIPNTAQQQKKSAFDAVVGFHNRSVEWVQEKTFGGITKTFGIQEDGDKYLEME